MFIKVKKLDYEAPCTFAPLQVDTLINSDDVITATPTEARGEGPFLHLEMRDKRFMTIVGTVDSFLKQCVQESK